MIFMQKLIHGMNKLYLDRVFNQQILESQETAKAPKKKQKKRRKKNNKKAQEEVSEKGSS